MRRALVMLLAWVAPVAPLAAQEEEDEKIPARMDWFPYLLGDANHGLLVIGHWQVARQSEYNQRFPHDWNLGVDGAWGTRGTRMVTVKGRAPLLVEGFRFAFDAGAGRVGRFGYYGQGPGGGGSVEEGELPADFFRTHRTRYYAQGEVSRRLAGPLYASAAVGVANYGFRSVEDTGLFALDYGGEKLTGTDATGRLTLVLDARDNELLPRKGVLLEVGVHGGTGRSAPCEATCPSGGYAGGYANFRGFVSPRRELVFAGRVAYRMLGEDAPLDARYTFPGWERDLSVYGGFDTNRGMVRGRLVGRRAIVTNAEVRFDLVDGGDYGALTLLAFLDGGGVWDKLPGQPFEFSGWKVGAGGGIAIRVLRQAIISLNFAKGPDGFNFTSGAGWAF